MAFVGRWSSRTLRLCGAALVSLTVATVGCAVEEQGNGPAAPTTDDTGGEPTVESTPDGSDEAVRVYVFAENGDEERFYERLRSSFEAETGIPVDLEVRLP